MGGAVDSIGRAVGAKSEADANKNDAPVKTETQKKKDWWSNNNTGNVEQGGHMLNPPQYSPWIIVTDFRLYS